jgi:hypothetical protein
MSRARKAPKPRTPELTIDTPIAVPFSTMVQFMSRLDKAKELASKAAPRAVPMNGYGVEAALDAFDTLTWVINDMEALIKAAGAERGTVQS